MPLNGNVFPPTGGKNIGVRDEGHNTPEKIEVEF